MRRDLVVACMFATACGATQADSDGSNSGTGVDDGIMVSAEGSGSGEASSSASTLAGDDADGDDDGTTSGPSSSTEDGGGTGDADSSGTASDADSASAGPTGSSGSAPLESGSSGGPDCPSADVVFEQQIPTVMVVIDRSSSMNGSYGDGFGSRWNELSDALIDPSAGIIATLQSEVRFGAAFYSVVDRNSDVCPNLDQVAPALDNLTAITDQYGMLSPAGGTPTAQSLELVIPTLAGVTEEGPKILLLATDGDPDSCEQQNSTDTTRNAVIAQVDAAFEMGIETYVIGVNEATGSGSGLSDDHLQDIADAGVGVGEDEGVFFRPQSPGDLVDALRTIINGVRPCTLELDGTIVAGRESEGTVSIDGDPVTFDDADGWRVNNPSQIELLGESCTAIQTGNVDISVEFPCNTFIGPQ